MKAWILVVAALLAMPARAAVPVVAVLYFDNHTGNAELDVLRKGFADMMVTDLAGLPSLTVVEREKLEALIDELKLQRTSYFDPGTAQKMGKGLGATHVITGSFLAMEPQLRVSVRLIELASGKVVLGEQVVGEKTRLFELQQDLVKRFVRALDGKLTAQTGRRTRADYPTVLTYSRGLDEADAGNLQAAATTLTGLVRKAPAFGLARQRLEDIKARLKAAEERRGSAIENDAHTLLANADAFLAAHQMATASEEHARTLLGYRYQRAAVTLWFLKRLLGSDRHPALVLEGKEAEANALIETHLRHLRAYLEERTQFTARFHAGKDPWLASLDTSFRLPPDDAARVKTLKLGDPQTFHLAQTSLAQFILLGRTLPGDGLRFEIGPAPGDTSTALDEEGRAHLDAALKWTDALTESQSGLVFHAAQLRELLAEYHLRHGRLNEAIAAWQDFLDRYPRSPRYPYLEKKIKEHSGLARNASFEDLSGYAPALETCDDMPIRKGLDEVLRQRMQTTGWAALSSTVAEAERACAEKQNTLNYVYTHVALTAARQGSCRLFNTYLERAHRNGASASDAAGYRKNYAPQCGQ